MTWRRLRKFLQETPDSMLDEEAVVYDEERDVLYTTVGIGRIDGDLAEKFDLCEDFPIIAV